MEITEAIKSKGIENLVYVTKIGSRLFGTYGEQSDTDYYGIYIPSKEDMLTDTAVHQISLDTNKSNTKNDKDDIDCKVASLHHWLNLLAKGETNALNVLFSMFCEDVIVYEDKKFTKFFKENKLKFLSKQTKSYTGFALSQAYKYGLKGSKLTELQSFIKELKVLGEGNTVENIRGIITKGKYTYIKKVWAPGPRKTEEVEYVEVLGKKFMLSLKYENFITKLKSMEASYGNRARDCGTGVEWKSLMHAMRVIFELEAIITRQHITYPLPQAEYLKSIKNGEVQLEEVLASITAHLDTLENTLIPECDLPLEIEKSTIRETILHFYEEKP